MNRNENRDNKDVRNYMNDDMRKGRTSDPVTQLLMWLLPALLLGVLVYYLYQRYYQAPVAETTKTEEVTTPASATTETTTPAAGTTGTETPATGTATTTTPATK